MRDPFNIQTEKEFKAYALELFAYQHQNNKVYRQFCDLLKVDPSTNHKTDDRPCCFDVDTQITLRHKP